MELDDFLARLDQVHRHPRGISARCPVPEHDDHVNSLSVGPGDHGGIVVFCHGTCTNEAVVTAMGLGLSDLMGQPYKVCEYYYTDMQGYLLYTVERWANPKKFSGYLPPPAERVLYNQICISWARANGMPVLWVEGEKDVDTCTARGIPSVTGCGGAGLEKILPQYIDMFDGVDVIVVADNDPPGRGSAREKVRLLRARGLVRSVRLVHSPVGSDISDLFEAGYGTDALEPLPEFEDVASYLAKNVPTRKVSWAWDRYLALGKIGLIEGDPGGGKSILTTDLAARWSTGMKMPDSSNGFGPTPVIMVSAEDDADDTIVPRLEAAGADLGAVHLVLHGAKPTDPFTFGDLDAIYRLIERTGARVVFFDPLMAFIDGSIDSHNDASVRRALQPLKIMASRTGAAVILVRHLNKGGSGTKAIYRGGGSIGFTGAARSVFLVTESASDPAVKVLANVKSNLAKQPPSLTYAVEISQQGMPYVAWKGPVDVTAQEALDGPGRGPTEASDERRSRKRARNLAGEFLLDILDEPMAWTDIVGIGKSEGFSARTLERARAEVGLSRITGEGGNATTTWARPEVPPTAPLRHFATSGRHSTEPPKPGEVAKWEPEAEASSDLDLDQKLDQELAEAELVCGICGTTINVNRYGKPYWLIRCIPHDPRYYGGANGTEEATGNSDGGGE